MLSNLTILIYLSDFFIQLTTAQVRNTILMPSDSLCIEKRILGAASWGSEIDDDGLQHPFTNVDKQRGQTCYIPDGLPSLDVIRTSREHNRNMGPEGARPKIRKSRMSSALSIFIYYKRLFKRYHAHIPVFSITSIVYGTLMKLKSCWVRFTTQGL